MSSSLSDFALVGDSARFLFAGAERPGSLLASDFRIACRCSAIDDFKVSDYIKLRTSLEQKAERPM